jgi:chromosome segregation ATPase
MASADPSISGYDTSAQLGAALRRLSKQAGKYEYQMKDLESKLAENLSNFRAIDSLLQESLAGLQRNAKRADRALNLEVPHINSELDSSEEALTELVETLPAIQSQVSAIRLVYDSGRQKAKELVADLEWLNTEFYERWRKIIFTSSSPVSWRWKALMRFFFVVSFIIFTWLAWIVLRGAYRAHRVRVIWGEKLMW